MKKRLFKCILLMLVILSLVVISWRPILGQGCKRNRSGKPDFSQTVEAVRERFNGREWAVQVDSDAISLSTNACEYYGSALEAFGSKEMSSGQMLFVIRVMQGLWGPDYADFADEMLLLYQENKIPKETLSNVFFSRFSKVNSKNASYFWHPKWRKVIREMASELNDVYTTREVEALLRGRGVLDTLEPINH